ncbi:MAG: hypothetical protein A2857_02015 [Candidatus Levybacteria bacterium RIFCSPHIGHO2_01_FULL_36_15]|nr:MAG: hypothetical protein A2857_02015 [Candidatus Levybacteria bacterium RIFCSPHIGHO2_01_FULL_36_15]
MKEQIQKAQPEGQFTLTRESPFSKLGREGRLFMSEDRTELEKGKTPLQKNEEGATGSPGTRSPDSPSFLEFLKANTEVSDKLWKDVVERRGTPLTDSEKMFAEIGIPMGGGAGPGEEPKSPEDAAAGAAGGGGGGERPPAPPVSPTGPEGRGEGEKSDREKVDEYTKAFIENERKRVEKDIARKKFDEAVIAEYQAKEKLKQAEAKKDAAVIAEAKNDLAGAQQKREEAEKELGEIMEDELRRQEEEVSKAREAPTEKEKKEKEENAEIVLTKMMEMPEDIPDEEFEELDSNKELTPEQRENAKNKRRDKWKKDREALKERIIKGQVESQTLSRDVLIRAFAQLSIATDSNTQQALIDKIEQYARLVKIKDPKKFEEVYRPKIQNIDKLLADKDTEGAKGMALELADLVKDDLPREGGREIDEYRINNLNDLAELIMVSAEDKWRRGGEFQLIEVKNGTEVFHPENFLAWVRSRALFYHGLNPDDPIDLLNQIGIPTLYRSINLLEILSTEKYFMKKEVVAKQIVDESTGVSKSFIPPPSPQREQSIPPARRDLEYEALKDQILLETWLFSDNHSADAGYRAIMGSAQKVAEKQVEMNYWNRFTKKRARLLRMLKLPGIQETEKGEAFDQIMKLKLAHPGIDTSDIEQEKQGKVGRDIRRLVLGYRFLPDEYMLKQVLGRDKGIADREEKGEKVGRPEDGMDEFFGEIVREVFDKEIEAIRKARKDKYKENWHREPPSKARLDPDKDKKELEDLEKLEPDIFGRTEDRDAFFEKLRAKTGVDRTVFDALIQDKRMFALKAWRHRFGKAVDNPTGTDWTKVGEEGKENAEFIDLNIYAGVKEELPKFTTIQAAMKAGVKKAEEDAIERRLRAQGVDINTPEAQKKIRQVKEDLDYANAWAFSFTYWTGISAYNETGGIGFDKDTVRIHHKENRIRQAEARGASGDIETLFGINQVGVDWWQGLKVRVDGRSGFDKTLLDVLMGTNGELTNEERGIDRNGKATGQTKAPEIVMDLDSDIDNFEFTGNAQRQFALEHIHNGHKVALFLEKHGLNLAEIVRRDIVTGLMIIDQAKFDELVKDGLWHDLRYCFDQPNFLWDQKVRGWVKEVDDINDPRNRKLKFKTTTLRQLLFDSDVTSSQKIESEKGKGMGMYERIRPDGSAEFSKTDKETKVARDLMAWILAQELKNRRRYHAGQIRWGTEQLALIQTAFSAWSLKVKEIEREVKRWKMVSVQDQATGKWRMEKKKVKEKIREFNQDAPFFTWEEFDKKIGTVGEARWIDAFKEELGYGMASATILGGWRSVKRLLQEILRGSL